MRKSFVLVPVFLFLFSVAGFGQNPVPNPGYYSPDPMVNISNQLTTISVSVNKLTEQMRKFVDKFEKVGGITFNEKQQKLILGMELLTRAEARVANLQKLQIDLTEKLNETRSKLAQTESDLRPRNIENSTTFAGSTEVQELRDNRKAKLQAEQINLSQLMQQLQSNLSETFQTLREAQNLAARLRKKFLPQIDSELFEQ